MVYSNIRQMNTLSFAKLLFSELRKTGGENLALSPYGRTPQVFRQKHCGQSHGENVTVHSDFVACGVIRRRTSGAPVYSAVGLSSSVQQRPTLRARLRCRRSDARHQRPSALVIKPNGFDCLRSDFVACGLRSISYEMLAFLSPFGYASR